MADIVITEFIDDESVAVLNRDFTVHYDPTLVDTPDELVRIAADVPALIVRNRTQLRGAVLAGCRRLAVIGRLGVGLDNIDIEECGRRGIRVFPAMGANTIAVAEYVIAAMLAASRDVWPAKAGVLAGRWPRNDFMLREIAGKTLGLIGFGEIARAVAKRARALGMNLIACDPFIADGDSAWAFHETRKCGLDELLRNSDFASIHVPLGPATRLLIDAAALARMRNSAILINTARGGIVDETALVAALRAGRLGGAVLDARRGRSAGRSASRAIADIRGAR